MIEFAHRSVPGTVQMATITTTPSRTRASRTALARSAITCALLLLTIGAPGAEAAPTTGSTNTTTAHATTISTASTSTVPPPPGSYCGQMVTVQPKRTLGPGPPPLAIGDSVLYDAAQELSYYGFETNAMVCRTMAQGIAWLQAHDQNLPVLVVVALGTNGAVTDAQIDELLSIVGPDRILAMVTPHNGNYAYVPGLIRAAAQQNPGRIEVLDWDQLSAGHPNWFAPDGIHLGGPAGINAYAQLVAGALLDMPTPTTSGGIGSPTTIGTPTTIQPSPPPRRPAKHAYHRDLAGAAFGSAMRALVATLLSIADF